MTLAYDRTSIDQSEIHCHSFSPLKLTLPLKFCCLTNHLFSDLISPPLHDLIQREIKPPKQLQHQLTHLQQTNILPNTQAITHPKCKDITLDLRAPTRCLNL